MIIQIFSFCKINQIFVIKINFDNIKNIRKIYFSFFNSYNDNYQFFVVDKIISFYFLKFFEKKDDRIKSFFFISLF